MHADGLTSARWNQVSDLVANRLGLHFPSERRADLHRALGEAAADFGCRDSESCADWLLNTPLSAEHVRLLARHLTIGETYFFRERPAFNALAAHVLPLLIHHKRQTDRSLRLWSAACSTGEEAYSLAMLVQQVLPDWRDWQVSILATDINRHFLRKAEAGVYGEWSFRDCDPEFRERHFSPVGNHRYRMRQELRELVRFAELNLAQDVLPSAGTDTQAMDLILCRNLLIYFTPEHARRLIANLRQTLVHDGWLIVSPSECSQALFTGYVPVNFPGTILYRKRSGQDMASHHASAIAGDDAHSLNDQPLPDAISDAQVEEILAPRNAPVALSALVAPDLPSPPPCATTSAPTAAVATAEALYARGAYAEAIAALRALVSAGEQSADRTRALGLLARALANGGQLAEALDATERWIAADRLDAAAHYLHAMVLQELGERTRARAALQCAVYLQPEFTLAHFALGNHARAEARATEARRHFANAARLLDDVAADEPVPESEGLTAGRLREIIGALEADS